jgi:hypothetical protein
MRMEFRSFTYFFSLLLTNSRFTFSAVLSFSSPLPSPPLPFSSYPSLCK